MSRFLASPTRALPLLTAVLLVIAYPAAAGEVYQWKDAKGVTHYSDSPPPDKGAYRNRSVRADAPPAEAVAAATVTAGDAKPADNSQCLTARRNLDSLKGNAPVGLDANNDGKPDAEMDAGQRASQVQLAEAGIKAWCAPTAAATP
jgi:hypothetical protein